MPKRQRRTDRERGHAQRKIANRSIRQRFLIVCEGERTEPNYFRAFRAAGLVVEIKGVARQALQLVERAVELREASEYDQVWCVFDRDDVPATQFNQALELAQRQGLQVACSNEAFELWYLLHFHYYQTGISRHDYIIRLSEQLGNSYAKNSETMYDVLLPLQQQALQNARRLLSNYEFPQPERDNPSTTVHLLVEELNRHRTP